MVAVASPDVGFPELNVIDQEELYSILGKYIHKAIPIKGTTLTVINGLENRISTPKPPYVSFQMVHEEQLSFSETRYTNTHKIIRNITQLTIQFDFYGANKIKASKMAKSFVMRFNDSWTSEQFAQFSNILFPLYSDEMHNNQYIDAEDQYTDCYSATAYFEYHPEVGMCQDSAKELQMQTKPAS
ncbi:phage neck terminator protein [Commensalibacter communis]|uniref:phage neck terminator protein n=1 Tax=Commensalibacter communis TaxID=2972786 RepID=UPI0022FF9F7B|nr:hypothetical protein [Commensalibacter communis]CAI3959064.1 unnamed protein product [Commensalibacter communis]CAI3959312.1 unnamed protein product [Commensalibacter communis]